MFDKTDKLGFLESLFTILGDFFAKIFAGISLDCGGEDDTGAGA